MTQETHEQIRQLMREEGAWNYCMQMKVYTTSEFILAYGHGLSDRLKTMLIKNVSRLQKYFDDRILEPLIK